MEKTLRIITRNSQLAMWQAQHVQTKIRELHPEINVEIIGITTQGDRILDKSLDKIGGKGLFIKELEYALLEGRAEIAVHSLKDLPANLSEGFTIAAVLEREESSDAFVSNNYTTLESLPNNAIVGTSSARRVAVLNRYYPHLQVKLLRGNVLTRLKKLDDGEYDGIILAVAGLKRLGLSDRIKQFLSKDEFVPAIGQGALAIEVLASNEYLYHLIKPLTHEDTNICVSGEREVGRFLQASCSIPIAAHATILRDELRLHAIILDKETGKYCSSIQLGRKENYLSIANLCATELLAQGADVILQKYI